MEQVHVTSSRLTPLDVGRARSLVPSRVAFEPLAMGLVESLKPLSILYMVRESYTQCPPAAQQNLVARQQSFKDNQRRKVVNIHILRKLLVSQPLNFLATARLLFIGVCFILYLVFINYSKEF